VIGYTIVDFQTKRFNCLFLEKATFQIALFEKHNSMPCKQTLFLFLQIQNLE